MDGALKEVAARRREAVRAFIDAASEVFATSDAEREEHARECTDEDCTFSDPAVPTYEDGWMLVVRHVPTDGSGDENFVKVTSKGLTWSRQLGFAEYIRDTLGRG